MGEDRLDDMRVVIDTELVRDGQEQRVSVSDRLVFPELLDEYVRFGCIAPTEMARVFSEVADGVLAFLPASEIRTISVGDEREDATTDRHPRFARMPRCFPRLAEYPDLLRLLDVDGCPLSSSLRVELCRFIPSFAAHTAVAFGPRAPPDPVAQTL